MFLRETGESWEQWPRRSGQTMHGHATRRYQWYEMRAAQGVGGDVNYFQTSICSRMTAQETSSTEDAMAADTGGG